MGQKKNNLSFKICGKSNKTNEIPPWCSSGKLSEKRKLPPNWEIQSSYPLRENIWEYLHDQNLKSRSKTRNRKTNDVRLHCMGWKILLLILLSGIIAWKNSSVSEQCYHEMKHLALELSRAEQLLRNTARYRMAIMTSRVKPEIPTATNSYITGATASKGSATEEWFGRVNLWGLIPLWRAPSPPDTVLALRRPIPADCWPFSGSYGELHIKLKTIQRVQSISIEHVRPDTARSAPKHFIAYGVLPNGTQVEAINNEYRRHGPAKQYYRITINAPITALILNVLTNHGNSKYTCIYRVHLYGDGE